MVACTHRDHANILAQLGLRLVNVAARVRAPNMQAHLAVLHGVFRLKKLRSPAEQKRRFLLWSRDPSWRALWTHRRRRNGNEGSAIRAVWYAPGPRPFQLMYD